MNEFSKIIKPLHLFLFLAMFATIAGCDSLNIGQDSSEVFEQTIEFVATQFTPEVPQVTPTETIKHAITSTLPPSPTVTSTPVVCNQESGRIEYREIVTSLSSHPMAVRVYIPPCYDFKEVERYPVLYLLHSQNKRDDQWERLGVAETTDLLIASNQVSPFIIVMPWESNSLEDDKISIFGQLIIDELIPWVDDEYRTCEQRNCRAIGGLSRGSAWAMRLGLVNWKLFGSIGAHSFTPFHGDFYNVPIWIQEIPEDEMPRIYIDIGALDPILDTAKLFEERLTDYSIPHEWIINTGTQNEAYWGEHVEDYIYWYAFAWKDMSGVAN
jgi:enterochelin esterase-like enzyme